MEWYEEVLAQLTEKNYSIVSGSMYSLLTEVLGY